MNKFAKFIFLGALLALTIKFWPKREDDQNPEKELHLALPDSADNMDPAASDSLYSAKLTAKVYEGLLEYHYLKRPTELIPNLAEAMPTISSDGLTYTFSIKKGVYFHDNACFPNGKGRELIAEDFVYSFKRIADPAVHSPYFSLFADHIKGIKVFNKHITAHKDDYKYPIEGIQALDRYTLQFTLTAKFPLFLHYLTGNFASVVAKEAVNYYGSAFINHPVGTGPFTLDCFNPRGSKITFVKNKNFREKYYPTEASPALQHLLGPAGKRIPFLDKITYYDIYEEQPRWLQFKEKKIDCIKVEKSYIKQVFENGQLKQELKDQGISLLGEVQSSISFIGFNCLKKPLDNKKLRQAMSLAFDRDTYNKLFSDGLGTTHPSFISSSLAGYSPSLVNPYGTYDVAKAKEHLAAAGYPDGKGLPTLTVDTYTSTANKLGLEFFGKCMAKIGIRVEIEQSIFPALLKKLSKQDYLMSSLSWGADYPDAAYFFCNL
ncbi:ABC transporter substrate-binding protein [Cardinium endosymbiont of Tipula unca]|uniref:ABC transporter substrate-binding protein n=1 Tax=Cardinium endosymbiont of Tipula unca TaxID=3066216 RepID=UPI0030CA9876